MTDLTAILARVDLKGLSEHEAARAAALQHPCRCKDCPRHGWEFCPRSSAEEGQAQAEAERESWHILADRSRERAEQAEAEVTTLRKALRQWSDRALEAEAEVERLTKERDRMHTLMWRIARRYGPPDKTASRVIQEEADLARLHQEQKRASV